MASGGTLPAGKVVLGLACFCPPINELQVWALVTLFLILGIGFVAWELRLGSKWTGSPSSWGCWLCGLGKIGEALVASENHS